MTPSAPSPSVALASTTRFFALLSVVAWGLKAAFFAFGTWGIALATERRFGTTAQPWTDLAIFAFFALAAAACLTTTMRRMQAAVEAHEFYLRADPEGLAVRVPGPILWRWQGTRYAPFESTIRWHGIVRVRRYLGRYDAGIEVTLRSGEQLRISTLVFGEPRERLVQRIRQERTVRSRARTED